MSVVTSKIECPSYVDSDDKSYIIILYVISIISLIMTPFAMYCIVFRSTSQMHQYKWYLLWHQVISFVSDIGFNVLGRPVVMLPFPMGYPRGLLTNMVPTTHLSAFCLLNLHVSFAAVLHLITFRYLAVKGMSYFPLKYKIGLGVFYFICCVPPLDLITFYKDTTEEVERLSLTYTCVSNSFLVEYPGFVAFDPLLTTYTTGIPSVAVISILIVACAVLIFRIRTLISLSHMSPTLRKMQHDFLIQLVLQGLFPLIILFIPTALFAIILALKIFGYMIVGYFIVGSVSSFSICSALVLIVMNPSYHLFVCAPLKRVTERVKVSSIIIYSHSHGHR